MVVVVGLFDVGFGNTVVKPPYVCDTVACNFFMDLDGGHWPARVL